MNEAERLADATPIEAPNTGTGLARVFARLDMTGGEHPKPLGTPRNVREVLRHDPRYAGKIRYNEFDGLVYLDGDEIHDSDEMAIRIWLDDVYRLRVGTRTIGEVLQLVAREHPYHPVREYLEWCGRRWDGVRRIDHLFPYYFGTFGPRHTGPGPDDDMGASLHQSLGRCFLISAVKRITNPGCKVDTTVVLYGRQGCRKSTALRVLASDDWFSDTVFNLSSNYRDALAGLRGVWIYELAEMDALSARRADASTIKAFLSAQSDRYREAYGRNTIRVARQTVFAGSTNSKFLRDPTGSRRFWPVAVGVIKLECLRADRDQLWGEAFRAAQDGEQWWLTDEHAAELAAASVEFEEQDPWYPAVEWYATEAAGAFTTADVLTKGLGKALDRINRADEHRVGSVLRQLGYGKRRMRVVGDDGNTSRQYVWALRSAG
jgi:putative DNA primase/helicase